MVTDDASRDADDWHPIKYHAHDGLRLAGRFYPARKTSAHPSPKAIRPLLCLPGLAGYSAEFHELALHLSRHAREVRDVWCPDYRGRGHSQRDVLSSNYNSYVELRDILDFITAFDLPRFDVLGSSRGGINAMLLATVRPAAIGRVILNDIGPVLEPHGVARLLGCIADMPLPADWEDARQIMQRMYSACFPALDENDWQALARRYYLETDTGLRPAWDERLSLGAKRLDLQKGLGDMWRQYLALINYPLLIIRGEHSDMLSRKTLEHMRTLHWRAHAVTVPGQGHAPLLRDPASQHTIQAFLESASISPAARI